MANEPELPWGEGRFTPAFPRLMELFAAAYPTAPGSSTGVAGHTHRSESGGPPGDRTPNPRIKSPLLCRLS